VTDRKIPKVSGQARVTRQSFVEAGWVAAVRIWLATRLVGQ